VLEYRSATEGSRWGSRVEQTVASNETLYRRVLGAAWLELHESVQRVHRGRLTTPYHGIFRVRHGDSRLARVLARALPLPAVGEMVNTQLIVDEEGCRQRWRRRFDQLELVTVQQAGAGGSLFEKFGPLQFRFKLVVDGGALCYRQTGLALVLGSFRCNLPASLAPTVSACEAPTDRLDHTRVVVEISLPGDLLLLRYEGTIGPVGIDL
jgi:hypothetical protein